MSEKFSYNSFEEAGKYAPKNMYRRSFIKAGVLGIGGALLGKKLVEFMGSKEKLEDEEGEPARKKIEAGEVALSEEEADVLFDLDQNTEITLDTIERLKNYWKNRYRNEQDKGKDITIALRRLERISAQHGFNVDQKIEGMFRQENVPPEFRFVAIPESYWNTRRLSRASAQGPYQFTVETARDFGLAVNLRKRPPIDERTDPIKSAAAAAKLFKDLLIRTREDSLLALSGYNGGFIWKYFHALKATGTSHEFNYEGFIAHINERVQQARETARRVTVWDHVIQAKETISSLSRTYGVSQKTLRKTNRLASDYIREGDTIRVSITTQQQKLRLYQKLTRGIPENINYVPKVLAVIEVLQERGIT